ncbi:MAG TPA: hypothetical protein DEF43_03305 [Chloroflexus aurantiacus]|nr:MAG: hypothetical protein D6716_04380 [Chloroflexota bacterium]HBW66189.1 hypothetical protein [Chloroflexus aurantiacus]
MAAALQTSRHAHNERARQPIVRDGTGDARQPFPMPYQQSGSVICCRRRLASVHALVRPSGSTTAQLL